MQTCFKDLSDTAWEIISKILNQQRKRKYSLRAVVNGILSILRKGTQWRNLETCYPPWPLVYYYFAKWGKDGTLERINSELNKLERQRQGKKAIPSLFSIDSQSIKVSPFVSKDKGVDGNKCINGRKRHVIVDTLGLVWGVVVHGADSHDSQKAHLLVEHCLGYLDRMQKILVDAAYKKGFMQWVEANILGLAVECSAVPPSRKGFVPVKWRWAVERTFAWHNFFRRLAKDYEKTAKSSQNWILWTNIQIILNRFR
ncbi:Transposase [Flexibacter flexilis DSM 6793]|uniref:Transposase n=1 Tax=Flexibacter flexilis DSM 6793 TaxID=927664 RepID=A0A1I1NFR5_9BACT|nr:IS5 family transposase [Flexibacter flexilis]SFC94308.1 Transposase [Flexibacter flexilis DSM 6793]